jgi:hypothetical protein
MKGGDDSSLLIDHQHRDAISRENGQDNSRRRGNHSIPDLTMALVIRCDHAQLIAVNLL